MAAETKAGKLLWFDKIHEEFQKRGDLVYSEKGNIAKALNHIHFNCVLFNGKKYEIRIVKKIKLKNEREVNAFAFVIKKEENNQSEIAYEKD
jgi:hypothetical protein